MAAIRIILTLNNVGSLPDNQINPTNDRKIETFFDDGVCDQPLPQQIKHFGMPAISKMISAELTSWLGDLGTEPTVISVTLDP